MLDRPIARWWLLRQRPIVMALPKMRQQRTMRMRTLHAQLVLIHCLLHLLQKFPRVFLIRERQACLARIQLKGVEERPVVIVLEALVDLLVPQYSPSPLDVDHLQKERFTDFIVGENDRSRDSGELPSCGVRVVDVEPGDGGGEDVVGGLGENAPDDVLFLGFEDRRGHGSGGCCGGVCSIGGLEGSWWVLLLVVVVVVGVSVVW